MMCQFSVILSHQILSDELTHHHCNFVKIMYNTCLVALLVASQHCPMNPARTGR